MRNTALIFAGGVGSRMKNTGKPKQFLELHDKPIIIHTLEHFEWHPEIDNIAVVCVAEWLDYFSSLVQRFNLKKIRWIVPGGGTGHESIHNGLTAIAQDQDPTQTIVLIHDGVRPLINSQLISDNIEGVKKYGSAITVVPAKETIIGTHDHVYADTVYDRSLCYLARAPQSFVLADILELHEQARMDNYTKMVDSASLMLHYGKKLYMVESSDENIKITTPYDYYIFRAIVEAEENMQILGL